MSETWITSDYHLGHLVQAQRRGFETVEEHDRVLLRNTAKRVQPGDRFFILGDLAMGEDKWNSLCRLADATRWAETIVVLGNHDRAHPRHRNAHKHLRGWVNLFGSVATSASVRHGGKTYLMSHFPYEGEGAGRPLVKDRDIQWRLRDEGRPLIHGHVHDDVRVRYSKFNTPMLHAGLDAWDLKPVTLHDLVTEEPDWDYLGEAVTTLNRGLR